MSGASLTLPVDRLAIERIIDRVLNNVTLLEAVKQEGISLPTLHKWLGRDKESALAYARAIEMRADVLADETIEIADTDTDAARARNRITSRQWLASKLNKKYGERVDLNVTQTIDVSSVLLEARARVMLPGRDQQTITDVQTLDLPSVSVPRALDIQSIRDDVPRDGDAPDIFS